MELDEMKIRFEGTVSELNRVIQELVVRNANLAGELSFLQNLIKAEQASKKQPNEV